jgi:hypothetical protein
MNGETPVPKDRRPDQQPESNTASNKAMVRPLRAMHAAISEADTRLLGGPAASLTEIARLLNRCAELYWRGMQHAYSHGQPEEARVLETTARRYEETAELCRAYAWKPKVRVPAGSPFISAEMYDKLTRSQQAPVKRRSFSVLPGQGARRHTRNYGIAALDAECWRVAKTPPGDRNNTLASAAFKVGRVVGAGVLDEHEAFSNLLGAALDCGLTEREARPVIRSGLTAGARKPRALQVVGAP